MSSLRTLITDRRFAAYFLARSGAELAFGIESVAIAWQIFLLRHQVLDLGLIGLMLFIPQLVLAIPAGVLADRFERRTVCVVFACVEMLCEFLFVALVVLHVTSLPVYFSAVLLIGTAHALGTPAERALLAGIVRSEHYVRAQAFSATAMQLITVAGPAIGGFLLAISIPTAFIVAAICYGIAAVGFSLISVEGNPEREEIPLREAVNGIRFIFAHKVILGAISLDLFAVLFGGATALLPYFASDVFHIGPSGLGILRSAPGLGAAVVAAIIVRWPIQRHAGVLMCWCVAGFGVATIVFGVSKNLWLSVISLFATGAFDMVSVVVRNALVMLQTPDEMRGRVGAVENIFIGASNQLGAFESGGIAALIGAVPAVALGGVATIVIIAIWTRLFPPLITLDRFDTSSAS